MEIIIEGEEQAKIGDEIYCRFSGEWRPCHDLVFVILRTRRRSECPIRSKGQGVGSRGMKIFKIRSDVMALSNQRDLSRHDSVHLSPPLYGPRELSDSTLVAPPSSLLSPPTSLAVTRITPGVTFSFLTTPSLFSSFSSRSSRPLPVPLSRLPQRTISRLSFARTVLLQTSRHPHFFLIA